MIDELGTDTAIVTATLTLTAVLTGWLGYRIRYRGDVHLIAGYRSGVAADTELLTQRVGNVTLAVAAVTGLAGLLYPLLNLGPSGELIYWAGYSAIVVVLGGYAVSSTGGYAGES